MADPAGAAAGDRRAGNAYEMLGSPEGELALAEVTVYLAVAPQIERRLHRLCGGDGCRQSSGSPMPPMDHPQCADEADEGAGLWRGLSI